MIYLDHAATSFPKAPGVPEEVARFLREDAGNPGRAGHALARRADTALARCRQALALLLGLPDARRLALISGTTEGLNVALRGLLGEGGRVVVGPEAHNSVLRPLRLLARERRVESDEVRTDDVLRWDLEDLQALLKARAVDLVVVTHGSNVTGVVQDLPAIARLARAAGARVLVDGAQTVGALPFDVADVDVLAFSGHKGLLGPTGTGGLYVREGLQLPPLLVGGTGTASEEEDPPLELPYALEAGTPNTLGCAGLLVATHYVRERTPAALHTEGAALAESLRAELAALPGVRLYTGGAGDLPVVSFTVEGWDPHELATLLDGAGVAVRAGLHCAPRAHRRLGTASGGTLRASLGPLLGGDAVEQALEKLSEMLGA